MKRQGMLRLIGLCALSLSIYVPTQAQEPDAQEAPPPVDFTRIWGSEDSEIVVPQMSGTLGAKNPLALQAILDFLKATNGAGWTGMQGTGTLTYSGENGESSPATLTVLNGDSFRLDVNAQEGQRSIRLKGPLGQILESDGTLHRLPLATAKSGLFAFPRLMASVFQSAATSVLDQGLVPVDGTTLHRVTISEPVFPNQPTTAPDRVSTVDLYFDPATHLLVKSAASVRLDSKDRAQYLQVMSYGDYRQVDGILLPFAYSQSLNGQPQWQLQLTGVQLAPQVDTTYFIFQ